MEGTQVMLESKPGNRDIGRTILVGRGLVVPMCELFLTLYSDTSSSLCEYSACYPRLR